MNSKTKKAEILIPDNMDTEAAQQCFLFGLRNFTYLYKGGVIVNYALDSEKGITNNVFYKEEAGAVIDFVTAIHNVNKEWKEKKPELEQLGGDELKKIIDTKIKNLADEKTKK